jgi:hypothetical protein
VRIDVRFGLACCVPWYCKQHDKKRKRQSLHTILYYIMCILLQR